MKIIRLVFGQIFGSLQTNNIVVYNDVGSDQNCNVIVKCNVIIERQ